MMKQQEKKPIVNNHSICKSRITKSSKILHTKNKKNHLEAKRKKINKNRNTNKSAISLQ